MKTDQERRVILAIALSAFILMAWQWFFPPPEPALLPENDAIVSDDGGASVPESGAATTSSVPSADRSALPRRAAPARTITSHEQALTMDGGSGVVSSENGGLRSVTLSAFEAMVEVRPLWTHLYGTVTGEIDEDWVPYAGGDTSRQVIDRDSALVVAGMGSFDDDGAGAPEGPSAYEIRKEGGSVVATRQRADGLTITKTYRAGDTPYSAKVEVTLFNGTGTTAGPLWVGVTQRMVGSAGSMFDRSANITHPQAYIDGLEAVMSTEDVEGPEQERFTGPVSWLGVADRYFLAAIIPENMPEGVVVMDALPGGRIGSFYVDEAPLDAGASRTLTFDAYVGPKNLDLLSAAGPDLDASVEYGWFGFFSNILLTCLEFFHAGVGNWGVAIILLTLTIKLLFFRLNEKALSSGEKMKKLQPEIEALKKKYKDDQQLQSQEMMKLWKTHGVSPLGGCLPMVVQMPVFFALYTVMYYSVELYDAEFLYLQDLTATDPYGVIPTLYALLMIGQQALMPTANMDPTQAKMMKMMPLFFAFIMFSFPSGLVLYFCVNMLLTIIQQVIIRRRLRREDSAAPAAA